MREREQGTDDLIDQSLQRIGWFDSVAEIAQFASQAHNHILTALNGITALGISLRRHLVRGQHVDDAALCMLM